MQSSREQRDKKAFLSERCKEIEENNRIEQTRDLFTKIGDTKETFHAKEENGKDLTEAEEIKKRWQEYTEELYKKYLHDPDNHDDVITNLEQTSWNVKSSGPQKASLRTKLVEVMEFQLSYFKSWKMML